MTWSAGVNVTIPEVPELKDPVLFAEANKIYNAVKLLLSALEEGVITPADTLTKNMTSAFPWSYITNRAVIYRKARGTLKKGRFVTFTDTEITSLQKQSGPYYSQVFYCCKGVGLVLADCVANQYVPILVNGAYEGFTSLKAGDLCYVTDTGNLAVGMYSGTQLIGFAPVDGVLVITTNP